MEIAPCSNVPEVEAQMNTFVLSSQTANLPVHDLLMRAASESVEVLDADGNVLAYVLSPVDREALIYAEAKLELDRHRDEVRQALSRRGGITTKQLLERAQAAAEQQNALS
jgi:hypothetical protein